MISVIIGVVCDVLTTICIVVSVNVVSFITTIYNIDELE